MKIYIARHGQTDWNIAHKAQGSTDIPLNDTGIQQAMSLQEKIKDIKFDLCYASPLKRAAKTAEIAVHGGCEIVFDDRLMERSFGDYEGEVVESWTETVGEDIGDLRLNTAKNNLEPVCNVLLRTKAFLDEIKTRHDDDETILIVAHGQIARGLHHNIVGYDDDTDWWSVEYGNAEAREYDY